ncbi:11000_t:CDS:2 [Ambispora gerdemannii]|uniref:11000_t:CDS:1 n=1 Tax=Ambispora gerdemannii TaxID=144530 RepID=A0A9N8VEC4_9GLOM|nr:11000_t:CDS:2 [Ambispora gerdemannii]
MARRVFVNFQQDYLNLILTTPTGPTTEVPLSEDVPIASSSSSTKSDGGITGDEVTSYPGSYMNYGSIEEVYIVEINKIKSNDNSE